MMYEGRLPTAYGKTLPWLEVVLYRDPDSRQEPPEVEGMTSSWEDEECHALNTSPRTTSQCMTEYYGPGADAVRTSIEYERSSSQWTAAAYDPPSAAAWLTQPPSFGLTGIDYFDDPILNTLVPMGGDQCQEVYNLTCCDPIASSSFPPLHIPSSSLSSSQSSCDGEALRPLPHTDDFRQEIHPPRQDKPTTSKRGRPSKQKTGKKVRVKIPKIWEFIRNLLLDPATCPSIVRWEDERNGVFRFVDHNKAARLWGAVKKNSKMSYEKMSRAMRYHYRSEALEVVESRRLVYKFGKKAKKWNTTYPNFESKEMIASRENATSLYTRG